MALEKCPECDEELPKKAKFCPNCGAEIEEKTEEEKAKNQGESTTHKATLQKVDSVMKLGGKLFSKKFILIGVCIGLFLIFIASLTWNFGYPMTPTKEGDFNIVRIATTLNDLGILAIGGFLLTGGLANKKINQFVRLAMILMGCFVIVIAIGHSIPVQTSFSLFG
ncbi:MAG: zinc ribbon domain-containing protein [Candidatus Thermoplasmatota archaeon]